MEMALQFEDLKMIDGTAAFVYMYAWHGIALRHAGASRMDVNAGMKDFRDMSQNLVLAGMENR
ncbi:hypothetical protein LguiB_013430 [Lonicera macranthoides]